jgi:hypothetical protein
VEGDLNRSRESVPSRANDRPVRGEHSHSCQWRGVGWGQTCILVRTVRG